MVIIGAVAFAAGVPALEHFMKLGAWFAGTPAELVEHLKKLESRFPGHKLEILNVGRRQRLVAFDTGPLAPGAVAPLSYP